METHIAEKLHAYTLPRPRPNSRVKDLPNIALLAEAGVLDASHLARAIRETFAHRATHPVPARLSDPPAIGATASRRYTCRMDLSFDQMTTAERILYVQELWDRIAAEADAVPLSAAQRTELQRRLADHEAHPEVSIPWETAREQVRQRR